MKIIATDILDNREKMTAMASAQLEKPGFAINPYFYRSHVTYEAELEHIVFKSWLYAGLFRTSHPYLGTYSGSDTSARYLRAPGTTIPTSRCCVSGGCESDVRAEP